MFNIMGCCSIVLGQHAPNYVYHRSWLKWGGGVLHIGLSVMTSDFSLAHILQGALRDKKEPFRENIGMRAIRS